MKYLLNILLAILWPLFLFSQNLEVDGTFQLKDSSQANNLVLTSDADGNASWQHVSTESILGSIPATTFSQQTCLALTGSVGIGTLPNSVAVSGNYAYVVDSETDDLKVINIGNPASPSLAGSLGIGDLPISVAVSGNYAYVVDYGTDDLKVIDISNPASPSLAGSLGIGTLPWSVAVSGNYAYVLDQGTPDLKVIDISNPDSLFVSGNLAIGGSPLSVAVSGNYAYVVDVDSSDLKVIDISNPVSPSLAGSLDIGTSPLSVAISGNYTYVVDAGTDDLKVIDISNPDSLFVSGSLGIGTEPRSVAVSGNYAYVVDLGTDDLKVIDISDPDSLFVSGCLGIGTSPRSVAVSGNYAYVVDQGTDDLKVIDISNPAMPSLTGSLGIGTSPRSVAVLGNYAYVVDAVTDDLKVINISNPASPSLVVSLGIGTFPLSVAVSGNYAYVVDQGTDDLKVIHLFCENQAGIIVDPITGDLMYQNLLWMEDTANANIYNLNDHKVGIGTITPTQKLDINGKVRIRELAVDNTKDSVLVASGDGTVAYRDAASLIVETDPEVSMTGGYAKVPVWNGTALVNGTMTDTLGSVGIGIASPTHILHVAGVARSTNAFWATSSDERVKQNVESLPTGSLDKILKLRPVTYSWKNAYFDNSKGLKENNTGFISQEFEEVFPDMVEHVEEKFGNQTISDFRLLNLSDLPVHIVKAIQEQQKEIEDQQKDIKKLNAKVEALQDANNKDLTTLIDRLNVLENELAADKEKQNVHDGLN